MSSVITYTVTIRPSVIAYTVSIRHVLSYSLHGHYQTCPQLELTRSLSDMSSVITYMVTIRHVLSYNLHGHIVISYSLHGHYQTTIISSFKIVHWNHPRVILGLSGCWHHRKLHCRPHRTRVL